MGLGDMLDTHVPKISAQFNYLLDKRPPAVDHLDPAVVVVVGLEVAELLLLHGRHVGDLVEGGLLGVGGHGGRQLEPAENSITNNLFSSSVCLIIIRRCFYLLHSYLIYVF